MMLRSALRTLPMLALLACHHAKTDVVQHTPALPKVQVEVLDHVELSPMHDFFGCPDVDYEPKETFAQMIAHIEASSTRTPTARYHVNHLVDYDLTTAWCAGKQSPGEPTTVTLHFKKPIGVNIVLIAPGYLKSDRDLFHNGRPRVIRIESEYEAFRLKLPNYPKDYATNNQEWDHSPNMVFRGAKVTWLALTFEETDAGSDYAQPCFSDIIAGWCVNPTDPTL